jgi:ATP-dependent DNA ligase
MNLPIQMPFAPMEALLVSELPPGPGWQFEPKWDGFRCLCFRDGGDVALQSKAGQPLARYFPEVADLLLGLPHRRFVVDGEIVVPVAGGLSFDDLLQRIHPAQSRVRKLAQQTPASLVVFDLLVDPRGRSLLELPLQERRRRLERFATGARRLPRVGVAQLVLSPATRSRRLAEGWLGSTGGGLDGVVAKRLDLAYRSGERAMLKVKPLRTADCVVGGFRYASRGRVVGSLLLGLYDDAGLLHHVGFTSSLAAGERARLTPTLEALIQPPGFTGSAPGGPSRWSTRRSSEWQPLAPSQVVEVQYDHFSQGRFRHGTRFLRWRPDKAAAQCTFEQVQTTGRGFWTKGRRRAPARTEKSLQPART